MAGERLCVLPDRIKQPDITLLTRHREFTRCRCRDAGELVLRDVLLELAVYHLRPGHAGIDAEEGVVRDADDGLFGGHLRILVVRGDVADLDVVVHLPFLHDLARLDVEIVEGMPVAGVHENHLRVLVVQHDLWCVSGPTFQMS